MPPVNAFLKKEDLEKDEKSYPLDVYFCRDCSMVQLLDIVSPEILFKEYHYVTSANLPMIKHFSEMAEEIIHKFGFNNKSLIMDIGSNDGTLLKSFLDVGYSNVLGVEPATNIAKMANEKGIRTLNDFFNIETSEKIKKEYGVADVITATNVFGHVDDLNGFVKGIDILLSERGVFVIEVPHLIDLIRNLEFDTIYHEHLSYFSLTSLLTLFRRNGMSVIDVDKKNVHGGSLRVFVQKGPRKEPEKVNNFLRSERDFGVNKLETYEKFSNGVVLLRENLVKFLRDIKERGYRIVGYGASAKGNVLLNYCNIRTDIIEYISDTTPLKQGLYTPGMHIPVVDMDYFHRDNPDYALLLAWNYADAIIEKEKEFIERGGKFILPIPSPKVV